MGNWRCVRNGTVVTFLALSTALSTATLTQAASTNNATVTVNTAAPLGVVPSTALGVNTAVWDGDLLDSAVPSLLKQINAAVLRYPGGSTSDVYHWANNTVDGGWANPNNNFDHFMGVVQASGTQPIITVNGGTGTVQEAADWVKEANVTHNYGVNYWEIGNELYGSWEAGNFTGNPTGYANKASAFIQGMKAVDPSIKIGVDLVAPGTGEADWNTTVLKTLATNGTLPDFVIVHWYAQNPGGESDAGLLSATDQIATMMDTLRQQIGPYGNNIQIFVTETNSVSYNPGKQTTGLVNALFLDDDITNWLQAGAANVDWWDLHNSITIPPDANVDPNLYGSTGYGDYGLLANGSSAGGITEPSANTPFPDYYGYQMLGALVQPGASFVAAGSSTSSVAVHASRLPNGDLAVMLINKDPGNAYNVSLDLEGFAPTGTATQLFYGEGSQSVSQTQFQSAPSSVQVLPYSVTDIVMHPQNGHQPQGPQVADSTTVSNTTIKPGYTQTVTASFTDTRAELNNATLALEIYNASGQMVGQQLTRGVSFKPGQTLGPVTFNWTVPDIQGTYTVKAFVLSDDGAATFLADENAATFTVTQPDPPVISAQVTLSASTVKVGTPVTISTTYTETAPTGYLTNGILCQYVFTSDWKFVTQSAPNQSLIPGQTVTKTWTWTPTAAGTYIVPEGVFDSSWNLIQWINQPAVQLTVTN